MSNLGLITLNVIGLRNATKRRAIFKSLRKKKVEVIFLQETHSTRDNERIWTSEWGGKILFAHGSSNSRGVAILFPRNPQVKIIDYVSDLEGRYILAQVTAGETTYTLLNTYAPTADKPEDQISYLDDLERCPQNADASSLIIGGDFNICIDPARDRAGQSESETQNNSHTNCRVKQRFNTFTEEFQIIDAWRFLNSSTNQYTFRRRAYASRLHFWLVSEHLTELV